MYGSEVRAQIQRLDLLSGAGADFECLHTEENDEFKQRLKIDLGGTKAEKRPVKVLRAIKTERKAVRKAATAMGGISERERKGGRPVTLERRYLIT